MRRLWAWLRQPVIAADVIAIPHSMLADRLDAVELRCRAALDVQAKHWPEDRNQEVINLAVAVLETLGDRPREVPVVAGPDQDEYWANPW